MDRLVAAMPIASAKAGELPPGVRIATGKPTSLRSRMPAVEPSVTPAPAPPTALPATPVEAGDIVFQVASFTARDNADRALTRLRAAGIDTAQLSDASANGQKIWRLRVGPLQAAQATELAARIAGLGFGQPQRVRD
jgi:rare lipoprotein A